MRRVVRAARALAFSVWAVVVACVVLELGLRATVSWTPGYYAVAGTHGHVPRDVVYPYGVIHLEREGIPDDLPTGDRPVVAWIGDSVLYGVGCGKGYRVTERLEAADPSTDQLNLGFAGFSGLDGEWRLALSQAREFHARRAVWLFNLNDIVMERPALLPGTVPSGWALPVPPFADHSYLWAALTEAGSAWRIRHDGATPPECAPRANAAMFDQTATRVRRIEAAFADAGIPLSVLVLPYEMQISADAERFYRDAGVGWEDGFVDGSPQQALSDRLDGQILDARPAFLSDRKREDIGLGDDFVATAGGRLDWDHLNRSGHAALASWLIKTHWTGIKP